MGFLFGYTRVRVQLLVVWENVCVLCFTHYTLIYP